MNEDLNLVEILKDCPEGTKLYSTVLGEVELCAVEHNNTYPILVKDNIGNACSLTPNGKFVEKFDSECVLFPSKEQRDWSKFNPKNEELVPPCEFKDGDILSYQCGCLKNRSIYIYRYHKTLNTAYYVALSGDTDSTFRIGNKGECALNGYDRTVRFATEEEKQKLFDTIKLNGYKWNAETKTLEKFVEPKFKVGDKIVNIHWKYMDASSYQGIISEITDDKYIFKDGSYILISEQDIWELVTNKKPKFDPKTLQVFDKVLVRLTKDGVWNATFFSHYDKEVNWGCYPCVTTSCKSYSKCIPYNDETKHLLGTSDEAPEFYRYWED